MNRNVPEPPTSLQALLSLNRVRRNIYGGTVDPEVVARRRAANKVARRARRITRRAAR